MIKVTPTHIEFKITDEQILGSDGKWDSVENAFGSVYRIPIPPELSPGKWVSDEKPTLDGTYDVECNDLTRCRLAWSGDYGWQIKIVKQWFKPAPTPPPPIASPTIEDEAEEAALAMGHFEELSRMAFKAGYIVAAKGKK